MAISRNLGHIRELSAKDVRPRQKTTKSSTVGLGSRMQSDRYRIQETFSSVSISDIVFGDVSWCRHLPSGVRFRKGPQFLPQAVFAIFDYLYEDRNRILIAWFETYQGALTLLDWKDWILSILDFLAELYAVYP
ncbi:hypothetical protein AAG570_005971 [Ranatra chinensis]|uniref:Uncharacterized protein n=1 Tax=Ranatra chinensis TaxID=642074 RepID=A0ABD0XWP1_9HEMI